MRIANPRTSLLLLSALFVLVLALHGCSSSGDMPSGPEPDLGSAAAPLWLQQLVSRSDLTPCDGCDPVVLDTLTAVAGIGEVTLEGPNNYWVAQDMTVGFRLGNGGFFELQIINYRERKDKGNPITEIEQYNDSTRPINSGEEPFIRVSYYQTPQDFSVGTVAAFRARNGLGTTWLTLYSISPEQMIGEFDVYLEQEASGEVVRIRSMTPDSELGRFVAEMSDVPGQSLTPVGVNEVMRLLPPPALLCPQPLGPGTPCDCLFNAYWSVDPNGNILEFGLDAEGNDFIMEVRQPFVEDDPTANQVPWTYAPTADPSDFYTARIWVIDQEQKSSWSANQIIRCLPTP